MPRNECWKHISGSGTFYHLPPSCNIPKTSPQHRKGSLLGVLLRRAQVATQAPPRSRAAPRRAPRAALARKAAPAMTTQGGRRVRLESSPENGSARPALAEPGAPCGCRSCPQRHLQPRPSWGGGDFLHRSRPEPESCGPESRLGHDITQPAQINTPLPAFPSSLVQRGAMKRPDQRAAGGKRESAQTDAWPGSASELPSCTSLFPRSRTLWKAEPAPPKLRVQGAGVHAVSG